MKTKGIPIWEQHIQHIVLGIAVVVCAVFTVKQFIGAPNAVEIGKGADKRTVSPGEIDQILTAKAEEILDGLAPTAPSPLEIPDPEPVLGAFRADLGETVGPETLRMASVSRSHVLGNIEITKADFLYNVPEVPAAYNVICVQDHASLSQEVIDFHPPLQAILKDPPYDLTWATPAAVFPLKATLEQFKAFDTQTEVAAIPASWYPATLPILNVVVEREERVGGEWTNLKKLDPISGQYTFRELLAMDDLGANDRDRVLDEIQKPGTQIQIIQPPFYDTAHNNWEPPDPLRPDFQAEAEIDPRIADIARTRHQLGSLLQQKQTLEATILEECQGVGEDDERDDRDRGGGGRGGGAGGGRPPGAPPGGGGGMGSGGQKSGRGDRDAAEKQRVKCASYQRQLGSLENKIRRAERRLESLGANAEDFVADDKPVNPMESDELVVWAHDLNVEVGAVYRYRFTIEVYNPFFARRQYLMDQQHDLADSLTMSSETSAWSEAIEIDPPLEFWITKANGTALAEVFRFYNGRWWKDTFNVEPGERIGGAKDQSGRDEAEIMVDFGTDWFTVDIVGNDTAAEVLLQNLRTGELQPDYIDPVDQSLDPRLRRLRDLVEQADAEQVAMASGG